MIKIVITLTSGLINYIYLKLSMKLLKIISKLLAPLAIVIDYIIKNWIFFLLAIGLSSQFFLGKDNAIEEKVEVIYKLETGNEIDLSPETK